jgi:hypothetical protein
MIFRSVFCSLFLLFLLLQSVCEADDSKLSYWNTKSPYPYLIGQKRSWPIFISKRPASDRINLVVKLDGKTVAEGNPAHFEGFDFRVTTDDQLVIETEKNITPRLFFLDLIHLSKGTVKSKQTLRVQPAPPDRPISYLADMVDDLIGFFYNSSSHKFKPISKQGLDQYFRRLQAHGVKRLIVWQSAFPFSSKPEDFEEPIRSDYFAIRQALMNQPDILERMSKEKTIKNWKWISLIMQLVTTPEFGERFSQSAIDHGISLTASFRPFESALQKYYTMPVFNEEGNFVRYSHYCSYAPFDHDKEKNGFAHYRMLLKEMGMEDQAKISTIELQNISNQDEVLEKLNNGNLKIDVKISQFPPLDPNSYVLVKLSNGKYDLIRYSHIQEKTLSKQITVPCTKFEKGENNNIRLLNLNIPVEYRYIQISVQSPTKNSIILSTDDPVQIIAKAGNSLGKFNNYWVIADQKKDTYGTRVGPLFQTGTIRSQFDTTRKSENHFLTQPETISLNENILVIDRGDAYTDEMINLQNAETRKIAIKQIRDILSYPAFDEILINTRSHTQFAGSWGDRKLGVRPNLEYRRKKVKGYRQLGLDYGYGPASIGRDQDLIQAIRKKPETIRELTHHVSMEWESTCQSPTRPFHWRYMRNKSIAKGLRLFFEDLRKEFPETRIRATMPPSATVDKNVKEAISKMKKDKNQNYDPDYFRYLCSYLNYIPAIGEGMTMVELNGLNIEPMILGYRGLPDKKPRQYYLKEFLKDLRAKHDYKGPYSFYYEAQESLRTPAKYHPQEKREEIIKELLANRDDIKEVILYEAANWIQYLPFQDKIHGQHGYLD